jgi:ABC-type glycerol-3-phosphate transport system substrate-binding protein
MLFAAQDKIPTLVNQYGMKLEDIGVALLPAGPAGRANQMGGNYFIINPKRPREVQEAAFKWISWKILGSMDPERIQENGEDLREQGQIGALSALPIFTGETYRKAREAAAPYKDVLVDFPQVWKEAAKYMRPEPPFFCQQLYSEYLGPAVQATLTEKDADPKTLLARAARGFQERFLDHLGQ